MKEMKVKRDMHGEVIANTRKRGQNGSGKCNEKIGVKN
jgi:hypothetical protein